jgi:heme exporter protein B
MRPSALAQYRALVRKDVRLELRTRETTTAMVLFSVLMMVIFEFALRDDLTAFAPGILWATITLTAVLAIGRSWVVEREQRVLDAILSAPVSRVAMILAKGTVIGLNLLALELVAVPLACVFFVKTGWVADLPFVFMVCLLADVAIGLVGTLVATLALFTRARDLILPVIVLPLLLPVVIAASGATRAVLGRANDTQEFLKYCLLIGGHALVLALVAYAIHEALFDD